MKTQKSPDCQHLQFSTHCQFIANNSAKVAWPKCLRKHSTFAQFYMTTPWLYDENSQFYTKICEFWLLRTWFMAQDDSALKRTKKMIRSTWCWKGRCHYWKLGKLPRRQLFFYMLTLKHSWQHRRTSVPSRIYIYILGFDGDIVVIYIYICIYVI